MKSISHRLLNGGIIAFVGKSSVAIGVVLVNALVARLLTPQETGLFMLALSIVTVAAVIADFGFGKTLLRTIPEAMANGDKARAISHIRHVFVAASLTVLVTVIVLVSPFGVWIAGKLSHGALLGELMPLVAMWLVVTVAISLLAETCRGFHHIASAIFYGGALTGLGNILIVSIVLGIAWLTSMAVTLAQVLILFIIAGALLSLFAILKLFKSLRDDGVSTDKPIRSIFKMAWPFWISSMALILLVHAQIWILGYFRSPEEVAAFALVARLALLVSFPLIIINSVLPPLISELHAKADIRKMERMLRISAGLTTLCSLLIFLILLIAGDWLSGMLFGEYFTGNWSIMMVLASGWLFHVWAGSGGFVLNMTDNQRSAMIINLVSGLVTVLSGLWLTQLYGGLGMAIASSFGLILVNVLMLLVIRYKLNIRIYSGLTGLKDFRQELIKYRLAARQQEVE